MGAEVAGKQKIGVKIAFLALALAFTKTRAKAKPSRPKPVILKPKAMARTLKATANAATFWP